MSKNQTTASKTSMFNRLFTRVPAEYVPLFKKKQLETNQGRMFVFAIYIVFLQIILNVINIVKPTDTKSSDIIIYIILSMGTLSMGVIYWILFALARRGKIKSSAARGFLVQSLLYLYIIIQLIFCTLNIISTGDINSYVIAILMIGLVPVLRPVQSIVTIVGCFLYVIAVMFFTRNISNTWNSILLTDMWTNVIIITGITICFSIFIYDMYVSNFLQSVALQKVNTDLEATVFERTHKLEEQTLAATVASRAKSDFLARMSHEIRTPLNAIMGMTQVARKATSAKKANVSLDEIACASTHLLGILNDVLDMSKIESGKFELSHAPFALRQALEEVAKIIALRSREQNIRFVVDFGDLTPAISIAGDKLRLKQILINLLGNAVKFTPKEGEIDFVVNIVRQTDSKLTVTFTVKDTGIGMTTKQVGNLFMAFEQADSTIAARYGGTGLGLAISQSLVESMGGLITVQSAPNQGSTFTFTLALPRAKDVKKPVAHKEGAIPDLSGKRILLVDDNEINRLILLELLEETHVDIDEAFDGVQALERFTSSPAGYYDLIFMDVQMPNLNGYETTRHIRELPSADATTIPIIAMTANAYKEDIERALESGMNGHIAKPIDINNVMNTLIENLSAQYNF